MLFLLFQLGSDRYALPVQAVREVVPLVELKQIPQAPQGVAGIMNYHGEPVPVLDLTAYALGCSVPPSLSTRIVLVTYQSALLGLIAEKVTQTVRMDASDFSEPGVTLDSAPYLGSVVTDASGVIQLVELEQLLPQSLRELLFQKEASAS